MQTFYSLLRISKTCIGSHIRTDENFNFVWSSSFTALIFWTTFETLKKLFAISFLVVYLFSTTELSQLLKMPLLVEHFVEHREENSHLTVWRFLYMHYSAGDVHDADYARDMQLPFKTHENCVASIINVFLPSHKVVITKPVQFIETEHFKTHEPFLQSTFLSNIWQPPKICWSSFNYCFFQRRKFVGTVIIIH